MEQRVFYLHEDEWAMIDLLPAENFSELLRVADEAQRFGKEHFDGFGWTDMYVIPAPKYSLSLRKLALDELQTVLNGWFVRADSVQSGYSSYREELPKCFAFVEVEEGGGTFYGAQDNGFVTALHILPYIQENEDRVSWWPELLHTFGMKYDVVLADWWRDKIIDLREKEAVVRYLQDD